MAEGCGQGEGKGRARILEGGWARILGNGMACGSRKRQGEKGSGMWEWQGKNCHQLQIQKWNSLRNTHICGSVSLHRAQHTFPRIL